MKLKNVEDKLIVENLDEIAPCGTGRNKFKFHTLSQIDSNVEIPRHGTRWGDWVLDTQQPSLDYVGGVYKRHPYWIGLCDLFSDSDDYGRWPGFVKFVKHLYGKVWGRENMGDFVNAMLTIDFYGYIDSKGKHRTRDGSLKKKQPRKPA